MTETERTNEIFHIIEVDLMKRTITNGEIREYQLKLQELIDGFPEGRNKDRVVSKIKDKQRFCYYINDTGNIDFTGYGKNFW